MVGNPDAFVHEAYILQDNSVGLPSQPINEPTVPLYLENHPENANSKNANHEKEDFHTGRTQAMNARHSSTASVTRIAIMIPSC